MPIYKAGQSAGGGGGGGGGGFTSMNQGLILDAYLLSSVSPETNSLVSATISSSKLLLSPFSISKDYTFDRVGLNITSSSGTVIRIGLFAMDFDAETATLVTDFGTVSSTSTGAKEIAISAAISASNFYLGITMNGNCGITSINDPTTLGSIHGAKQATQISNAIPYFNISSTDSTLGFQSSCSVDATDLNSTDLPSIWLRRSV